MPTTPATFPWSVLINPDWYDDPADAGYSWSGSAASCEEAVNAALAQCWADNERSDAAPPYDPSRPAQDGFQVMHADVDFRELAAAYIRARRRFNDLMGRPELLGEVEARSDSVIAAGDRLDAAFKASGRDA